MADPKDEALIDEAAEIFLALREAPEDGEALARRAAFLSRGPAAARAWNRVARVWGAGARGTRRGRKGGLVLLLLAGLLGAALWPTAELWLRADRIAGDVPQQMVLVSGDRADLDAGSALIDQSEGATRDVTLLEGAAFFDVETRPDRPFVVRTGEVSVTVLGTQFEVSEGGGAISVAVLEGAVSVDGGTGLQRLAPGQRFSLTPGGAGVIEAIDPATIAAWRQNRLFANNQSFAEVAAAIDRRMPGSVVIVGEIGAARVSGSFDLSRPRSALRALAAVEGAEVFLMPYLTIIDAR
ncbi:MAG: FecR domain-containing protein [Pseudomonadota bacterium]